MKNFIVVEKYCLEKISLYHDICSRVFVVAGYLSRSHETPWIIWIYIGFVEVVLRHKILDIRLVFLV